MRRLQHAAVDAASWGLLRSAVEARALLQLPLCLAVTEAASDGKTARDGLLRGKCGSVEDSRRALRYWPPWRKSARETDDSPQIVGMRSADAADADAESGRRTGVLEEPGVGKRPVRRSRNPHRTSLAGDFLRDVVER